ncbi:hypothetical protein [Streptomyces noursei]|uniref:hypothetical protein n=1 Tax=Streptomyces noursei TaxID=1971 RepID=UPI001E2F0683|nr:hypothetical protein [Streptomyces noursei]MCZ1021043.1 hypothetical protein [Streptomyces noursei]
MSKPQLDLLSQLWDEHMRAPFPPHLRGREINGEDLVLLDAGIAGCVSSSLSGPLDEKRRRILLGCLAAVEKVLPSLGDGGDAIEYYERLRAMAALTAEVSNAKAR